MSFSTVTVRGVCGRSVPLSSPWHEKYYPWNAYGIQEGEMGFFNLLRPGTTFAGDIEILLPFSTESLKSIPATKGLGIKACRPKGVW